LKIGNGENQVIEFSDPDCGYCRKASEFFSKREDVTRYIFFFPLSEQSETKVRHILCSADRERAYKNVYEGKLDGTVCVVCKDEKVEAIIKADRDAGNRLRIRKGHLFLHQRQSSRRRRLAAYRKIADRAATSSLSRR